MGQLGQLEPLDPNNKKDYKIHWHGQLEDVGDTIQSSTWPVVPTGIVKETDTHDSNMITTIWLSVSSAPAGSYKFTNRIATVGGRILDQSITIEVKEL